MRRSSVISIECADSYPNIQEGLEKAVAYLQDVLISPKPGQTWWF